MKNRRLKRTIFFLILALSIAAGLANIVSARWRIHDVWQSSITTTATNGQIWGISSNGGFGGWNEGEPEGELEEVYVVRAPSTPTPGPTPTLEAVIVNSYTHGPAADDPVDGLELIIPFWLAKWDATLAPGDLVYRDTAGYDGDDTDDPDALWRSSKYAKTVVEEPIEESMPAPSLYRACASSSNTLDLSDADIQIYDLDVWLFVSSIQGSASAQLLSANGTDVMLFDRVFNEGNLGTVCSSDHTDELDRWAIGKLEYVPDAYFDDEEVDESSIPDQPLSRVDGESTNGEWTLNVDGSNSPNLECWCLDILGYRTARFANDHYEVNENTGTATAYVELSEPSTYDTSIKWTAEASQNGIQYTQTGIVTFPGTPPGSANRVSLLPVTIDIADDNDFHGDETITLKLDSPTNEYGIGTPSEASLNIMDDDARFYSIFFPTIYR